MLGFVKFHVLCSFSSTVVYFALRESVSCFSFPSVLSYFSSVWFCLSCPVQSCCVLFYFSSVLSVLSCSVSVLSCPVLSCPVQSCCVLLYFSSVLFCMSCPVLSCPVLSCPVLSCSVLSCSVLSCPVLFCPVLSCSVLSYFSLFCSISFRSTHKGRYTDDLYNDFNRRSKNGMKTLCY
jgi:hypothetical protein